MFNGMRDVAEWVRVLVDCSASRSTGVPRNAVSLLCRPLCYTLYLPAGTAAAPRALGTSVNAVSRIAC